jgi:hypothetical protein
MARMWPASRERLEVMVFRSCRSTFVRQQIGNRECG